MVGNILAILTLQMGNDQLTGVVQDILGTGCARDRWQSGWRTPRRSNVGHPARYWRHLLRLWFVQESRQGLVKIPPGHSF